MIFLLASLMAQDLDPTDPAARYDLAAQLSRDGTTSEEARDMLIALMAVPEFKERARDLLVDLVMGEPARVGWATTYRNLRNDAAVTAEQREVISLRAVQAPPWTAVERHRAIARALAMKSRTTRPTELATALGHLYMLDGNPSRALAYFRQVVLDEGAAGEAYALMALGRPEQIHRAPARPDIMLTVALSNPTPANRARALFHGGYGYLSRRVTGSARNCRQDACVALAEIQEAKGDYRQEALAWKAYLRQVPRDVATQGELVDAYLDARDLRNAKAAAAKDEALLARVEAVRSILYMSPTAPLEDRDAVTAAALGAAGRSVQVVVARARVLTEMGRYQEAVDLLRPITRSRGGDPVVLWAWAQAAIPAGQERDVLALWHSALQRAISVERRRELGVDLAIVYGIIGEYHKKTGQLAVALVDYRTAIAMQPGRSDLYTGLGGLLWKAGRKEEARQAYLTALSLNPSNLDALASAAILSVDLDDPGTATALVARAPATSPAIARAREIVQNAHAIVDAHGAARGDREAGLQTLRNLATDYVRSPDVLQAVGYAMLDLRAPQEALPVFRIAAHLRPGDPWLKLGEITALVAIPDLPAAEAAYADLEAMDTSEMDPAVLTAAQIALLRAQGNQAARDGDPAEALDLYQQVLELDPRDGWTWVAIGDLFLADHRPATAMAYYGVALDPDQPVDPERQLAAHIGQMHCYEQLGRLDEAEASLSESWTGEMSPEMVAELEREVRLARLNTQLEERKLDAAQRTLAALAARWPEVSAVRVGAARMALALDNPQGAVDQAIRALALDPRSRDAAATLRIAAERAGRLEEFLPILEEAWHQGGDSGVLAELEEGRFLARLGEARKLQAMGRWKEAVEIAEDLWDGAKERADHSSQIGGLFINLQLEDPAAQAFDQALELDPDLAAAILGKADLYLYQGRPAKAESWLAGEFRRTGQPEVGLKLAEVQKSRRHVRAAERSLERVKTARPDLDWDHRLPLVALPDGSQPPVEMVVDETEIDPDLAEDIAALEEDLALPLGPELTVQVDLMHQTGTIGQNYLFGEALPIHIDRIAVGPLDLQADLLPVSVGDGETTVRGLGMDAGASLVVGRWGGRALVGVSPLGFPGGSTPLYQVDASYNGHPFVFGLNSARQPITDSVASWAGARDADGTLYGRVAWTWFGGLAAAELPGGIRGGARIWAGWLDGLSMPNVSRQQVAAWLGRRFGGTEKNLLVQGRLDYLVHNRQVDGFSAGNGGAFTPLSYVAAFVEADGRLADLAGLELCGGLAAGLQSVTGDNSQFLPSGIHPILQAFAGLSYPFAKHWWVGGQGFVQVADSTWMQELGTVSLHYLAAPGHPTIPAVPELQGTRLASGGCK